MTSRKSDEPLIWHASIVLCGAPGGAWLLNWWDEGGDIDDYLAFKTRTKAVAYLMRTLAPDKDMTTERLDTYYYRYTWEEA